jgi:hypothetical protein
VHNSDRKIFVEIFVGRGILSRAMVQSGFSVLSVDHENNGAVTPLDMLDLTTSMGVKVLWDILSSPWGCSTLGAAQWYSKPAVGSSGHPISPTFTRSSCNVQRFGERDLSCMLPWVAEAQDHCLARDKRIFLFTCSRSLQPVLRLHDLATAAQGKRSEKHHPLRPKVRIRPQAPN